MMSRPYTVSSSVGLVLPAASRMLCQLRLPSGPCCTHAASCSGDAQTQDTHAFVLCTQATAELILLHLLPISNATTARHQVHHLSTTTPADCKTVKPVNVKGLDPCCSCLLDMSHCHHSVEPLSLAVCRDAEQSSRSPAVYCWADLKHI